MAYSDIEAVGSRASMLGIAAELGDVSLPAGQLARWRTAGEMTSVLHSVLWQPGRPDEVDRAFQQKIDGFMADNNTPGSLPLLAFETDDAVFEQLNGLADRARLQRMVKDAPTLGALAVASGQIVGWMHQIPLRTFETHTMDKAARLNIWLADAFGHAYAMDMHTQMEQLHTNGLIRVDPNDENRAAVMAAAEESLPSSDLGFSGQTLARGLAVVISGPPTE